jgi:hypothetical protein
MFTAVNWLERDEKFTAVNFSIRVGHEFEW